MKDKKIAATFKIEKEISELVKIFFTPKTETAPRVGIERRNEIFVASTLLKLSSLAAVIVIPDLLTPGIKDIIWKIPIIIADFILKLFSIVLLTLYLSLKYNRNPKRIVVQAISLIFLKFSIRFV